MMIKSTVEIISLLVVIRLPLSRQQQCQEGNWHADFPIYNFVHMLSNTLHATTAACLQHPISF